jgi:hypothetical protein
MGIAELEPHQLAPTVGKTGAGSMGFTGPITLHQRCNRSIAKIFNSITVTFESSIKIFDSVTKIFESSIKTIDFIAMTFDPAFVKKFDPAIIKKFDPVIITPRTFDFRVKILRLPARVKALECYIIRLPTRAKAFECYIIRLPIGQWLSSATCFDSCGVDDFVECPDTLRPPRSNALSTFLIGK